MKRIIAMLLAVAAMVCCAGCGGSGGGAATTMTEEDFCVYENGEVVYTVSPGTSHDFTEEQETKRGIHIGSTLEEVVQAYKGEYAQWAGLVGENATESDYDYEADPGIMIGDDVIKEKKRGSTLYFGRAKRKDENIRVEKGNYVLKSGEMSCILYMYIKDNVVDSITAAGSQYKE